MAFLAPLLDLELSLLLVMMLRIPNNPSGGLATDGEVPPRFFNGGDGAVFT